MGSPTPGLLEDARARSWHGDVLLLGARGSGAAELGVGASGCAAGRRGDDRKIEVVEVMASGVGVSGAPPGVTG